MVVVWIWSGVSDGVLDVGKVAPQLAYYNIDTCLIMFCLVPEQ
jgi:hypothetical protein